jgi:cytochrome c biogenesis protein CcdA/thiol-disulfide isomerase/thioredoxin
MLILLFFSFLAGIVTVLSPCILPILPVLLAAGPGTGHRRTLGIIMGLVISFTFFTLTLTALVHATGVSPDVLRYCAIGLIIMFGLVMIFPSLANRFAALTSGFSTLGSSLQTTGSGFSSGILMGFALGLLWTPCAGPILATITTLVATRAVTISTVIITLAYSIGAALPMFLIAYGSNKVITSITSLTRYSETIRTTCGALIIMGALAIAFHADAWLQQFTLNYFPMVTIDNNTLVQKELGLVNTEKNFYKAPAFVGIAAWLNSPALTIEQLRGKVVLIDFWTYSCINCVRTLPYLKAWYEQNLSLKKMKTTSKMPSIVLASPTLWHLITSMEHGKTTTTTTGLPTI